MAHWRATNAALQPITPRNEKRQDALIILIAIAAVGALTLLTWVVSMATADVAKSMVSSEQLRQHAVDRKAKADRLLYTPRDATRWQTITTMNAN